MPSQNHPTRKCYRYIPLPGLKKGEPWTVPNGPYEIYQDGSGGGLDVFINGRLLAIGEHEDYLEQGELGSSSSEIKFHFSLAPGDLVTTIIP